MLNDIGDLRHCELVSDQSDLGEEILLVEFQTFHELLKRRIVLRLRSQLRECHLQLSHRLGVLFPQCILFLDQLQKFSLRRELDDLSPLAREFWKDFFLEPSYHQTWRLLINNLCSLFTSKLKSHPDTMSY